MSLIITIPLQMAASRGHLQVVKYLVNYGANIKAANRCEYWYRTEPWADMWPIFDRQTPLHLTASDGP